jgi:hypothetical protein
LHRLKLTPHCCACAWLSGNKVQQATSASVSLLPRHRTKSEMEECIAHVIYPNHACRLPKLCGSAQDFAPNALPCVVVSVPFFTEHNCATYSALFGHVCMQRVHVSLDTLNHQNMRAGGAEEEWSSQSLQIFRQVPMCPRPRHPHMRAHADMFCAPRVPTHTQPRASTHPTTGVALEAQIELAVHVDLCVFQSACKLVRMSWRLCLCALPI